LKTRNPFRPGFTLTELLVVILIIAVLAVIGFTATRSAMRSAAVVTCSNNLRQIGSGFAQHQADFSRYPSSKDGSWDVALLPYLGYSGDRKAAAYTLLARNEWSDIEKIAELFKCPADTKKDYPDLFPRSYSCVPWTTNLTNGTWFRGWKGRPYNTGVPIHLVDDPARAAVVVEWHIGSVGVPNALGSGAYAYADQGGKSPDADLHSNRQVVLFADGHTEVLPILSGGEFIKKYWPRSSSIGNAN